SGSPGEFTGQEGVWEWGPNWESLIQTTASEQLSSIRSTVRSVAWHTLVPDFGETFVTGGRGTKIVTDTPEVWPLDNDYVTAAHSPDGTLGVVFLPASSTITVDTAKMGLNPTARWVDPTNGDSTPTSWGSSYTSPGVNASGDDDWLL